MSRPRLLVSVAEASGDRLAAEVLRVLCAQVELAGIELRVSGIAGPALRQLGVREVAPVEDLSVMGLAEVLRHLPRVRRARRALFDALDEGADALMVVDAPDLNLPLAAYARARGIPVIGLVSPQVWAWRRARVHTVAARFTRLCCLFAFEPALYSEVQAPDFQAVFTGPPVLDRLPRRDPATVDPLLYALLPGSRPQERRRHLGPFLKAAERLRAQRQGARFLLAGPTPPPGLPDWVQPVPDVAALSRCRGALCKSGTVTLELAVLGLPMVVAHCVHPLTWWIGRALVRDVHHLAMPNVLADIAAGGKAPEVVPEHLQQLDPDRLARALLALPEHQPIDLSALGTPGAAARMAEVARPLFTSPLSAP